MSTTTTTPTTPTRKEAPISLTPNAIAKVKGIMAQQNPAPAGLRVGVVGVRKNDDFARGWNLSACLVEGFAGSLRNSDRGRCVQPPIRLFKLPEENNDVFFIHQKTRGHWRGE